MEACVSKNSHKYEGVTHSTPAWFPAIRNACPDIRERPLISRDLEKELISDYRSFCPYPWDCKQNVVFNVLCFLQMGILIDVYEMLGHKVTNINHIGLVYYNYCNFRRTEVILENCPQILIQALILINNTEMMKEDVFNFSNGLQIASLVISVVCLPLALCAHGESSRYCDRLSFDYTLKLTCCLCCSFIKVSIDLGTLYLGYLLMISSRLLMLCCIYILTEPEGDSSKLNYIPGICVLAHHAIILTIYLLNQIHYEKRKSVIVTHYMSPHNIFFSFLFFSFSEVFLILLAFPESYRGAIVKKNKDKASLKTLDERWYSFAGLYCLFLAEATSFLVIVEIQADDMLILCGGRTSLGLFLGQSMRGSIYREPTETSKQPIRTCYFGHVIGYQPIRDQLSVPAI
eukprot:sb/3465335/